MKQSASKQAEEDFEKSIAGGDGRNVLQSSGSGTSVVKLAGGGEIIFSFELIYFNVFFFRTLLRQRLIQDLVLSDVYCRCFLQL